jgi:16S rRNA (uracil1498-N3)-methyltransferase
LTRRRWIADEVEGDRAALIGDHADHLARVLRARVGQQFDLATVAGVRRAIIAAINKDRVEFELGEVVSSASLTHLTLLLAIFKFDRMEWAIEKCTELGVAEIVPLIARRTESHLAAASAKRVERWRRLARQASEQSRRDSPPKIAEPVKLADGLKLSGTTRIVLRESEEKNLLRDVLESGAAGNIVLAVGPEGGWTDEEVHAFRETGWASASLGQTILRAETAAVAATALAVSLCSA